MTHTLVVIAVFPSQFKQQNVQQYNRMSNINIIDLNKQKCNCLTVLPVFKVSNAYD